MGDGIKSKLTIFSLFKSDIFPESYLQIVNILKYLISFCKFRCSNHHLAIEQRRHSTILKADSICRPNARSYVVIEDEYHFLLISDDYKLFRQRYVTKQSPPYDETHSGFQKKYWFIEDQWNVMCLVIFIIQWMWKTKQI